MADSTPKPVETRRRRRDGELTWRRVIDAAIESILENGYYHTSSNEIARRAGVTWGAIQHQFGTREGLLLEVLNDRWNWFQECMATAEITGDTLEQRLNSVLSVLALYYEQPVHLVQVQILLDLTQNPNTSAETKQAVAHHGERLTKAWQPLFVRVLGDAAEEADLVIYAFSTLRGYLGGRIIQASIGQCSDDTVERNLLVRGVAAALTDEAARRGITIR